MRGCWSSRRARSPTGPYVSAGDEDRDADAITLEPLAHSGPDGALIPALAPEIPTLENGGDSADQRSNTWMLRDRLKWLDGSEMTAAFCQRQKNGRAEAGDQIGDTDGTPPAGGDQR